MSTTTQDPRPRQRTHATRSSHALHGLGRWSAHPAAGVTVAAAVAVWVGVGALVGFPDWWEKVLYSTASSITVVMVFAIQHTQRREQLVTQRKLDELLRAQPEADNKLITAEAAPDEELEALADQHADHRRVAT